MSISYIRVVGRSWRVLLVTLCLGAACAFLLSFVAPLERSSTVRLLITQANATGLDAYTSLKSTERIASSLNELIYTTTFFQSVIAPSKGIDPAYFPSDDIRQRKAWRKAIETSVVPGSGVFLLTVYHVDANQARLIADAAAKELANIVPTYFGFTMGVRVIDAPLDSRWIARPNFVQNTAFGALAGGLLGVMWVLYKTRKNER